jgi:Sigma-70, region 4
MGDTPTRDLEQVIPPGYRRHEDVSPREAQIVRMRDEGQSLGDVARRFGVSIERIRQVEKQTRKALCSACWGYGFLVKFIGPDGAADRIPCTRCGALRGDQDG